MENPTELDRKVYLQTWPLSLDICSEERPEIYGYSETSKNPALLMIFIVLPSIHKTIIIQLF